MPSGAATVPDTRDSEVDRSGDQRTILARGQPHHLNQLVRGPLHLVIDDHVVELRLGGELDPRRREAPLTLVGSLGAPHDEAPHELLPAWRSEEDEPRRGRRLALSLIHISEPTRLGMISYA